jgi:translation initiation factor 2D
LQKRHGNKIVTVVNNLELYGVDVKALAQLVRVDAAASATIVDSTQPACCKGLQLIVQGNQVRVIARLLTANYGIAVKNMNGLELAPKIKK